MMDDIVEEARVDWIDMGHATGHLEEYVDAVVAGAKPCEPWEPCMFAAVDGPTPS